MNSIGLNGKRVNRGLAMLGASALLLGLAMMTVVKKSEVRKRSTTASVADQSVKETKSRNSAVLFFQQQRVIPDSDRLTLEQARNDAAVKFLVPRALPEGAKLTAIFRVPMQNENASISKETIAQRYDINGKYLEIWATPKAKAPDYKRIADEGTVKVPEQNPDGSIRMQTDGSIKWVRKDNSKFVTVNGMAGIAGEPYRVKDFGGNVIDNPGVLYWWANGTEYSMWGLDMPVAELLKIAESMN